ncbi:type VI secretion system lipoprotein TssJ [Xenorhabdus lircayensis]|uniref:Type VI secretion system lipoprotein TssJ n=1 Tax=Xenorhabdus lircayensis TaxID=2763499 RepID=A0ABS0UC95_9GAMM|nr:type VI secretion system lipoprotein TssJ [Xenorhabdus lircayensis]MBI6550371.1 type VI secretion system lipoprotein TssJ [Xenorhabdus lircayensis]
MVNTGSAAHENPPFSNKIFGTKTIILLFLTLITLTGCASSPEQKKLPPYKLIFDTTNSVNDSAPLKIRVILLKSNVEFMSADFFSLQGNAQAVLGDKLVNTEQFFLLPFQHKYFLLEKNTPETSYIGIFAEYKQLDGKKWRISVPVPIPEQPAFYEFWVSSPDELSIYIQVTANGLSFINKCN